MTKGVCKGDLSLAFMTEKGFQFDDNDRAMLERAGDDNVLSCDEFDDGAWVPFEYEGKNVQKWYLLSNYLKRRESAFRLGIKWNENFCNTLKAFPMLDGKGNERKRYVAEAIYANHSDAIMDGALVCNYDYGNGDLFENIPKDMVKTYSAEFIEALDKNQQPNPYFRLNAVNALEHIARKHGPIPEATDDLARLLDKEHESNDEIRSMVLDALCYTVDKNNPTKVLIAAYLKLMDKKTESNDVIREKAFNAVHEVFRHTSRAIVDATLRALQKEDGLVNVFGEAAQVEPDKDIRRKAAFAFVIWDKNVAFPEVIETLRKNLDEKYESDTHVRANSAWALGDMGEKANDERTVEALIIMLEDKNDKCRKKAAEALGSISANSKLSGYIAREDVASRIVGFLENMLCEKCESVDEARGKVVAIEALGNFGPAVTDSVIKRFIDMLSKENESSAPMRGNAADAFRSLGIYAARPDVMDALKKTAENDDDVGIRNAAYLALIKIDSYVHNEKGKLSDRSESVDLALEKIGNPVYEIRAEGYEYLHEYMKSSTGTSDHKGIVRMMFGILGFSYSDKNKMNLGEGLSILPNRLLGYCDRDFEWAVKILGEAKGKRVRNAFRRIPIYDVIPEKLKLEMVREYFTDEKLEDGEKSGAIAILRNYRDTYQSKTLSECIPLGRSPLELNRELISKIFSFKCTEEKAIDLRKQQLGFAGDVMQSRFRSGYYYTRQVQSELIESMEGANIPTDELLVTLDVILLKNALDKGVVKKILSIYVERAKNTSKPENLESVIRHLKVLHKQARNLEKVPKDKRSLVESKNYSQLSGVDNYYSMLLGEIAIRMSELPINGEAQVKRDIGQLMLDAVATDPESVLNTYDKHKSNIAENMRVKILLGIIDPYNTEANDGNRLAAAERLTDMVIIEDSEVAAHAVLGLAEKASSVRSLALAILGMPIYKDGEEVNGVLKRAIQNPNADVSKAAARALVERSARGEVRAQDNVEELSKDPDIFHGARGILLSGSSDLVINSDAIVPAKAEALGKNARNGDGNALNGLRDMALAGHFEAIEELKKIYDSSAEGSRLKMDCADAIENVTVEFAVNIKKLGEQVTLIDKSLLNFYLKSLDLLPGEKPNLDLMIWILGSQVVTSEMVRPISRMTGQQLNNENVEWTFMFDYFSLGTPEKKSVLIASLKYSDVDIVKKKKVCRKIINSLLKSEKWSSIEWDALGVVLTGEGDFVYNVLYDAFQETKKNPAMAANYALAVSHMRREDLTDTLLDLYGEGAISDYGRCCIMYSLESLGYSRELEERYGQYGKRELAGIYLKTIRRDDVDGNYQGWLADKLIATFGDKSALLADRERLQILGELAECGKLKDLEERYVKGVDGGWLGFFDNKILLERCLSDIGSADGARKAWLADRLIDLFGEEVAINNFRMGIHIVEKLVKCGRLKDLEARYVGIGKGTWLDHFDKQKLFGWCVNSINIEEGAYQSWIADRLVELYGDESVIDKDEERMQIIMVLASAGAEKLGALEQRYDSKDLLMLYRSCIFTEGLDENTYDIIEVRIRELEKSQDGAKNDIGETKIDSGKTRFATKSGFGLNGGVSTGETNAGNDQYLEDNEVRRISSPVIGAELYLNLEYLPWSRWVYFQLKAIGNVVFIAGDGLEDTILDREGRNSTHEHKYVDVKYTHSYELGLSAGPRLRFLKKGDWSLEAGLTGGVSYMKTLFEETGGNTDYHLDPAFMSTVNFILDYGVYAKWRKFELGLEGRNRWNNESKLREEYKTELDYKGIPYFDQNWMGVVELSREF